MSHFVAFYRWIRYCGFNVAFIIFKFHLKPLTRRLAACTQAVVILRSTSYIAIELKCSVFEVVRNSIESMCSSYSACLRLHFLESINSLLLVHGPLPRKMNQDRYAFAVVVVCLFVSFLKQEKHSEFLSYGGS